MKQYVLPQDRVYYLPYIKDEELYKACRSLKKVNRAAGLLFKMGDNVRFAQAANIQKPFVLESGCQKTFQITAGDRTENVKHGKAIRRLLGRLSGWVTDADIEELVNLYRALISPAVMFETEDISGAYNRCDYINSSDLGSSCMQGEGAYMGIYSRFNCRVLVAEVNGDMVGRALIWPEVRIDVDGQKQVTFMDRVYTSADRYKQQFVDYAKSKGYWYKVNTFSGSYPQVWTNAAGITYNICAEVQQSHTIEEDYYPYIDTFYKGDDNSLNNYGSGQYTYHETDGAREGDHSGEVMDYRGEWIDEDDAIYLEAGRHDGEFCHVGSAIRVGNTWYHEDDEGMYIIQVNGDWYEKDSDDIGQDDRTGKYYLIDDLTYLDTTEEYVYCDYAHYIETGSHAGEYCHVDDKDEWEGIGVEEEEPEEA